MSSWSARLRLLDLDYDPDVGVCTYYIWSCSGAVLLEIFLMRFHGYHAIGGDVVRLAELGSSWDLGEDFGRSAKDLEGLSRLIDLLRERCGSLQSVLRVRKKR